MAHDLLFDRNTGAASIVIAEGGEAWHGFGVMVDFTTATDAMRAVGSDYTIEKVQNVAINPFNGEVEAVEGHTLWCPPLERYGLAEQQFGQVGPDYVPINTADIAATLDAVDEESGQSVTGRWPVATHGIVSGGTRMFYSLNGGTFEVKGSPVSCYVNIRDNKMGTGAFDISVGGTRIVCRNTFEAAGASALITANIRHTGNAANEVQQRLLLIAQAQDAMERMKVECAAMAETALTDDDVKALLKLTYPDKKVTRRFQLAKELEARGDKGGETFRKLYGADLKTFLAQRENDEDAVATLRSGVIGEWNSYNGSDQNEAHGSSWAYFNAVTAYVDHTQVMRGSDAARALFRAFGKGAEAKSRAYNACAAIASGANVS